MAWDVKRAKQEAEREGFDVGMIPVKNIDPRRREHPDLAKADNQFFDTKFNKYRWPLKELSRYIESKKVLVEVPFAVKEDGKYIISEGRHRTMAAIDEGHKSIPLLIKDKDEGLQERRKDWEESERLSIFKDLPVVYQPYYF